MCIRKGFRLSAVVFCISDVLFSHMAMASVLTEKPCPYLENAYSGDKKNHTLNHREIYYRYDHYSRLGVKIYPNHMQAHYTYNEYNGLANLVYEQFVKPVQMITQFSYAYNRDGNIRTRVRRNVRGQCAQEHYTYDGDNNLSRYQCLGELCPQDQRHNRIASQKYAFDSMNNIKTVEGEAVSPQDKMIVNTTIFYYSKQIPTQLLLYQNSDLAYGHSPTLVYDKDGNVVQDDQRQVLAYDAFDRLRSIQKVGQAIHYVTYLYNGDNLQVGQQYTDQYALYWIYGQGQLIDSKQGNLLTQYIYGDMRLAKVTKGHTTYYLTDQGKSVVHLVQSTSDNQPDVIASYAYSPYGIRSTLRAHSDIPSPLFGFDGELTDPITQWQFLGQGYRAYNPLLHRFMSQDRWSPFAKGGVNGYWFANNNPIAHFDPSGHMSAGLRCPFGKAA